MGNSLHFSFIQAERALKQSLAVARRAGTHYARPVRQLLFQHIHSGNRRVYGAGGIIGVIGEKQLPLLAYQRKLSGCAARVYA